MNSGMKRMNKALAHNYSEIPNVGFHRDLSFTVLGAFNFTVPNILCSKHKYELFTVAMKELLHIDYPSTFIRTTDELNKIVIHPTMKIGQYGISTFIIHSTRLTSDTVHRVPKDNYGLAVMPLARVLRLFGKHHCFAVRGVIDGVKYMPDSELATAPLHGQTIPRDQFYAMQLRKPLSDRVNRLIYPEFGCLMWATKDEASSSMGVSIQQARSYVGMYDGVGVFYQSYTLHDPTELSSVYSVEELIVIQEKTNEHILDFNIKIVNSSNTRDLVYYGYNNDVLMTNDIEQYYGYGTSLTIPRLGGIKAFNTKLRMKNEINELEMVEPTHEIKINVFSYPININDRVNVVRYDDNDGFALVKMPSGEPQVYCTGSGLSITHPDFSYDIPTNQWLANKKLKRRR